MQTFCHGGNIFCFTTVGLDTTIEVVARKYFANYLETKTAAVWFECNPGSSRFNQTKCWLLPNFYFLSHQRKTSFESISTLLHLSHIAPATFIKERNHFCRLANFKSNLRLIADLSVRNWSTAVCVNSMYIRPSEWRNSSSSGKWPLGSVYECKWARHLPE